MPMSDYELERQRRIQENKARMAQMGLTQTITDLKAATASERALARQTKAARRAAQLKATVAAPSCPSAPRRRSGRVKGEDAPLYDGSIIDAADSRSFSTNYQEELYSMDHVRALGTYKMPWVVFVDGYDEKGERIYDKVNGKTCHQCRQKTLGKRTSCSSCQSLQGQFCGDCLFQRYGENIEEANENPEWMCPNCKGLCNCSFHRSKRGWAPTGSLFPHAYAMGFSSVAHYLVLNNLEPAAREEALAFMPLELAEDIKAELAEEKNASVAGGGAAAGKDLETGEETGVGAAKSENYDEKQNGLPAKVSKDVDKVVGIKRKAGDKAEAVGEEGEAVAAKDVPLKQAS